MQSMIINCPRFSRDLPDPVILMYIIDVSMGPNAMLILFRHLGLLENIVVLLNPPDAARGGALISFGSPSFILQADEL